MLLRASRDKKAAREKHGGCICGSDPLIEIGLRHWVRASDVRCVSMEPCTGPHRHGKEGEAVVIVRVREGASLQDNILRYGKDEARAKADVQRLVKLSNQGATHV